MTEENKELLIKNITTRLPYGVKVLYYDHIEKKEVFGTIDVIYIDQDGDITDCDVGIGYLKLELSEIKPYLFPLSSMTNKQKEELFFNYIHNDIYIDDFIDYFLAGELWHDITVGLDILPGLIDWLNKNHFDYRGLIEKGLALDATGLNIY